MRYVKSSRIVIMPINIFMEKRGEKMITAERISLFQPERVKRGWNPEEDATNYLLQISNQQSYFPEEPPAIGNQEFAGGLGLGLKKSGSALAQKGGKRLLREGKGDAMARSQRKWRKSSINYLSGEQVCVMRKQKVVHLSNFPVFQQQQLSPRNYPKQEHSGAKSASPVRGKLMTGLLRRRNGIFAKEYSTQKEERLLSPQSRRAVSPTQRMNQSCELRKQQSSSPLSEMRSTSPNFRNKKVINYFKYRLSKQGA